MAATLPVVLERADERMNRPTDGRAKEHKSMKLSGVSKKLSHKPQQLWTTIENIPNTKEQLCKIMDKYGAPIKTMGNQQILKKIIENLGQVWGAS